MTPAAHRIVPAPAPKLAKAIPVALLPVPQASIPSAAVAGYRADDDDGPPGPPSPKQGHAPRGPPTGARPSTLV